MSRGRTKLAVQIPLDLKAKLTKAINAAALPAVNWTSVVTQALEAHLPKVEALASAAKAQRTEQQGRALLRRLEQHIRKTTITNGVPA